ncbi:threonine aldolase family protein [Psychrobacillus sp. NPDC096623]|uniref:threonine aldolase family protein n=1 Tax=Psychrobacillus sp. NPDC096623 TaxID=3364492 RepID=UPI00380D7619
MIESISLIEAYKQTQYQIAGNGKRNIQVLKDAFEKIEGEQESDIYGNGEVIEAFQVKMATYLGKESAVFFPSGTMAQQIALRIWCDEKEVKKVAYHPLSHLEIHEEDGLKELHHIDTVLLGEETGLIGLEDVLNLDQEIACLLLELPQREIGGQLPDYKMIVEISEYCKANGIRLHLDGARLFEILPYYQKSAAEVCGLFDSVYISFYKGLSGLAGAILAGNKEFTQQSKVWKRRHGGDLISLYPYIISANYYFDKRISKMDQYYESAKELAALFNSCPFIQTKPVVPVSNMFHVHINRTKDQVEAVLKEIYNKTSVGLTSYLRETNQSSYSFEVSVGDQYSSIPKDKLHDAFQLLQVNLQ